MASFSLNKKEEKKMAGENQNRSYPQKKVCAECEKPWSSSQDQCTCGSKQSKWIHFDPQNGDKKVELPPRIVCY